MHFLFPTVVGTQHAGGAAGVLCANAEAHTCSPVQVQLTAHTAACPSLSLTCHNCLCPSQRFPVASELNHVSADLLVVQVKTGLELEQNWYRVRRAKSHYEG